MRRNRLDFHRSADVRTHAGRRRRWWRRRDASGRGAGVVVDRPADHGASGAERRRRRSRAEATGSATPTASGPASDPLPSLPASVAAPITVLSNELGEHAAAQPGLGNRDEHDGPVVAGRQRGRADQCLLALRGRGGRRRQQLFHDVGRTERARWPGGRQRPDHGAGQRHRAAERGGLRARTRRSVLGVDSAERSRQRGRTGEHLLGQRRSRREHVERLRHHRARADPATQTGVVDAEVPVTVCDVIAEIDGNSSADCPQQPDPATQQGRGGGCLRAGDGLRCGRRGRRLGQRHVHARRGVPARQRSADE